MVETRTVVGATTATLLAGIVGYAAWFDYKRRHDVNFRRKIALENRQLAKKAEAQASAAHQEDSARLRAAVKALQNDPSSNDLSMQAQEQYFLEHVSLGESLAPKGPQYEVEASIAFFKALRVYPAPHDLIQIYQKTLPAPIFANIMQCFVLDRAEAAAPRQPSGNAILEEIDVDEESPKSEASSPKSGTSAQYVHV